MVTIMSHISDYFEQFNSSLTAATQSSTSSHDVSSSIHKIPLTFYVFDFERYSDQMGTFRDLRTYMIQRWHNSFFYALAYLFLIYTGQIYMKNKPRFELRLWLAAWNTLLALFSIFGAMRVLPELIYVIYRHGLKYSICNNSNAFGVVGFWTWAFCFSKLPELVDTVFIVLRKQPLIFLHWYHHASVLIYCWFSYQDYSSTGRWFCGLNYIVHGIMYSYYALRALKFRISRWVSMIITTLQLTQMVIGCGVNLQAWQYKKNGETCQVTEENLKVSLIMYGTYFLLFAHFFLGSYIFKSKRGEKQNEKRQRAEQEQEQNQHTKKID
jgi:elongation of very long chain fatty acids protein 6